MTLNVTMNVTMNGKGAPRRLRRCQLSVPGSSEKMMAKAAAMAVDQVTLDLEDAVAPTAKNEARLKVAQAVNTLDWGRKTVCVRINDLGSEHAYQDVIHLLEQAHRRLDVIMLPKARSASDILWLDVLLSQIEKKLKLQKRIGLEAIIEEVGGMIEVENIARCSPRLEALVFGMGDFAASQGVRVKHVGSDDAVPGGVWGYHRSRLVIATRAAGIDAVDGPMGDFSDPEAFRRECTRSFTIGYSGKWAIHPSQVAVAQDVFSPSMEEVVHARRLAAAYADAEAKGLGSIAVDGVMVDVASIRMLEPVLQMAELIEAVHGKDS